MCSTRFMNEYSACCHKSFIVSNTDVVNMTPAVTVGFSFLDPTMVFICPSLPRSDHAWHIFSCKQKLCGDSYSFSLLQLEHCRRTCFHIYIYKLWSDHYASAAAETGGSLAATNICGCNSWTVVSDYHWQWGGKQLSSFLSFFTPPCFGVWSHMLASIYAHYLEPWSALPVGCGCVFGEDLMEADVIWGALFGTILG